MINDFIYDVCDILEIDPPEISEDTSNFSTSTMMAQCEPSGRVIYIKKREKQNPDLYFAIAHELRHIWQFENENSKYFEDYNPVELCDSVEAYNLQIAELDANAFAYIVMVDFFGMKPLFHGVSDFVKSKIYERIEELKKLYEEAAE